MAAPSTPENMNVQSANGQIYVSWDQTATATSYTIQRSIDNVTYPTVVTGSNPPGYLDTTVALGVEYWYKVAAVNIDGTSSFTTPQSEVATTTGEMTLGQIRANAQRESDMQNNEFITMPEWNTYINNSLFELYDLLIDVYDDYYFAQPAYFTTTGSSSTQALPNGVLTFQTSTGSSFVAPPLYKLCGIDLGVSTNSSTGWVSIKKYMFADRNKYFYPNTNSTIYGVFNMQYRMLGQDLHFIPQPSGNQPMRMWYIPKMTMLLKDTDITTSGVSGWIEYVIVDAAIKALQKEESDTTVLMMRKEALKRRIEAAANNRDQGQPDTISDTRGSGGWGQNGGIQGFGGGF